MQKACALTSFFLLVLTTALMVVGLATNYWVAETEFHSGLWKTCLKTIINKGEQCFKIDSTPDFASWLKAVRALVFVSIILAAFTLLLLLVYLCRENGRRNLTIIKVVVVVNFIAATLCLVGVIVYSAKQHSAIDNKFGWSFILTAIAGCVTGVLTVPLLCEIKRGRRLGMYESI